ncbi:protein ALP1-like [Setaria italica]|uniref:protein ALP1-like n=1 Tax=Setaria italica TaxID=4555 RepID=UPI000BE612A8|nr:protein ALP1-like [Setaria italica]XP_022684429.1 protein ALP1-like [Setaria italica]
MDNRNLVRRKLLMLITAAAAYAASCMVALFVMSRILSNKRQRITYGPMEERDKSRIEYLNTRIYKDDTTCTKMIRLKRISFFQLCQVLRERSLLRDTKHVCIEEQVAMFLNTVGHNLRNRLVGTNFNRSGETVSRYFGLVLHAIGELRNDLIRPPSLETPAKIAGNPRWDPYFKDCIGAIDGTHIRASVSKSMEAAFRGRKSFSTQNVMAAVDFDLKFTYVLAGWEGTAHDAVVLADAIERENGLRVPEGKFYLVDAGYGAKPGFMPPFRAVRYHLNEWGNNPVQNAEELFNLRHSSLRVTIERAFGSLKRRFKILDDATPFFPFRTQVDIVLACCILHNWVISQGTDRFILPESNWTPNPRRITRQLANDHRFMVDKRQLIAEAMWADRQNHYGH